MSTGSSRDSTNTKAYLVQRVHIDACRDLITENYKIFLLHGLQEAIHIRWTYTHCIRISNGTTAQDEATAGLQRLSESGSSWPCTMMSEVLRLSLCKWCEMSWKQDAHLDGLNKLDTNWEQWRQTQ